MRVGVLGPGGVGGLLAALLTREGAEVTCIATESTAIAIAQHGLSVTSARFGSFHVSPASESELQSHVDVLCVTVKATALEASLTRIAPDAIKGAIVVPFLNGIEHVEIIRSHFPDAAVIAATIRVESARVAPGEIEQVSPFARVDLAPRPADRERAGEFADVLQRAGIDVELRDDEERTLWEKLSFLAPLALLTTAHDAPAGVMRSEHRDELVSVIGEITQVSAAAGVAIDATNVLAQIDGVPETMRSSMQRDARAGKALEIDAIGGAIVRAGTTFAIPTPAISRLVSLLEDAPMTG
jgi:2-dehydropantoate 2-reductase